MSVAGACGTADRSVSGRLCIHPARDTRPRCRQTARVLPIVGGLGAALAFTLATMSSTRASRLVGASSTLAGVMLVGLAVGLPIALLTTPLPALDGMALVWIGLAGFGNVIGLLLVYSALRIGTVGVVTTLASTEGAIAAVIAVLVGEALRPGAGPALAVLALGAALAATGGGTEVEEGRRVSRADSRRAAALALAAAVSFGIGLYATGRVGGLLPLAWAILPARLVGTVFVALPLLLLGRVRISRAALPFVLVSGLAELAGYVSFVTGAHDGIAIAAVLTSLFAPFSTLLAFVVFGERLGRRQLGGIALVMAGVGALGALQH